MADDVRERFGIETDLLKGHKGVFEVTLDGELLFSKKTLGRFPEPDEVESLIGSRVAS